MFLVILCLKFLESLQFIGNQYTVILITCAISALGILLREFLRSYYFFRLNPERVLLTDLVYILWAAIFILALWYCDVDNLHIHVLAVLGISSLLASAKGSYALYKKIPILRFDHLSASLKECWPNGKWALLGVIVTWLQGQSYIYLITPLMGAEHTAVAHAGRLLLMPVVLLNMSYGRILRAKWAQDLQAGSSAELFKASRCILFIVSAITGLYAMCLYAGKSFVIGVVLKSEYLETGSYIILWAIFFVVQAARSNFSLVLQVHERFRKITIANTVTALFTIALGVWLTITCGARGSLHAMIAGEAMLASILSLQVKGCRRLISPSV
jgi:O-antigen/teichoic acid export membrane protein